MEVTNEQYELITSHQLLGPADFIFGNRPISIGNVLHHFGSETSIGYGDNELNVFYGPFNFDGLDCFNEKQDYDESPSYDEEEERSDCDPVFSSYDIEPEYESYQPYTEADDDANFPNRDTTSNEFYHDNEGFDSQNRY